MTKYAIILGGFHMEYLPIPLERAIRSIINEVGVTAIFLVQDNNIINQKWPLPFEMRTDLLRESFPKSPINICPIPDCEVDVDWTEAIETRLDVLLPKNAAYTIYLSENAKKSYQPKKYNRTCVIKDFDTNKRNKERPFLDYSDSKIMMALRRGHLENNRRPYGFVYPTVDIAVIQKNADGLCVLLGKKKNGSFYRLPGGFVDGKDISRGVAARRELFEETGLSIEGNLMSLGDFIIDDWRYRNTSDSILTTLFLGDYSFGMPKAGDDLEKEVAWKHLGDAEDLVGVAHKPLIKKVKEYYDIKN